MPDLLCEKSGHVAHVMLSRPERLNAISPDILAAPTRVLEGADRDREVRAIVLTGAGRGFCGGLDPKDTAAGKGIASIAALRGTLRFAAHGK